MGGCKVTKTLFRVSYLLIPLLFFLALSVIQSEGAPASTSAGRRDLVGDGPRGASGAVYYIKAEGIVNPVMAEFLIKTMKKAEAEGAEAVVIQLDTPGGLDLSMRDIVKAILSSEVPVVVYVAPAGSRAASAGVFIAYAAHIAAMAPGTNIGSAHPVSMGSEKMDKEMEKKVTNDAVAYIKSIAGKRKRNAEWAEKAVRESVNITAEEAVRIKVIDLMAPGREELLKAIDGRKVEVVSGLKTLKLRDAEIRDVEMNLRFRVLNAISNPNVAYILMMIGIMGLYFELSNPGSILPGVVGAICLVLAFYAFQTLSLNYAGLLLIGLAFIFFIVELKVVSYGLLTIAGLVSLVLGSLMLFDSPLPFMRLSLWVMLPAVLAILAVVLVAMYYALLMHRRRPVSGAEGLIGEEGSALDDIPVGGGGKVFVGGEYWDAETEEALKKGDKIKVVSLKGLTLKVTRA